MEGMGWREKEKGSILWGERKKERKKELGFWMFRGTCIRKDFSDYLAIHLGNVCVTGKKRLSSETFCTNTLSPTVLSFASSHFLACFLLSTFLVGRRETVW
jgi:hypothetical protein